MQYKCISLLSLTMVLGFSTISKGQNTESYLSQLQVGDEGKLSIPLSGQPSPFEEEQYLTPHPFYENNQNVISIMKQSLELNRKESLEVFGGDDVSIRAFLELKKGKSSKALYGQIRCNETVRPFDKKDDPVLGYRNFLPASIALNKNTFPVFFNEEENRLLYDEKTIINAVHQYQINVNSIPQKLCEEVVINWNNCERIELEFKLSSDPYLSVDKHGINVSAGTVNSAIYSLRYLKHSLICKS